MFNWVFTDGILQTLLFHATYSKDHGNKFIKIYTSFGREILGFLGFLSIHPRYLAAQKSVSKI